MKRRYVLAPEAALDLVQIWRYMRAADKGKRLNSAGALFQDLGF